MNIINIRNDRRKERGGGAAVLSFKEEEERKNERAGLKEGLKEDREKGLMRVGYRHQERQSSEERERCDEIINIKEEREVRRREESEGLCVQPRKTALRRGRTTWRDNKYQERQENKRRGGTLVRRMQRSEDSRIKIGAEARIMQKRAALTRSTMQDQDTDPRKKNTRRS